MHSFLLGTCAGARHTKNRFNFLLDCFVYWWISREGGTSVPTKKQSVHTELVDVDLNAKNALKAINTPIPTANNKKEGQRSLYQWTERVRFVQMNSEKKNYYSSCIYNGPIWRYLSVCVRDALDTTQSIYICIIIIMWSWSSSRRCSKSEATTTTEMTVKALKSIETIN